MSALDTLLASPDVEFARRVRRWQIERASNDSNIVFARLVARDAAAYRLLMECDGYPVVAPSVVFVDDAGNKQNPSAWPRGTDEFGQIVKPPQQCFLCTGVTREGLAHHPNWRGTAEGWDPARHTLFDVLALVQSLLDSPSYQGRG